MPNGQLECVEPDAKAKINIAFEYYYRSSFEESDVMCREVLRDISSHPTIIFLRGLNSLRQNRTAQGLRFIEEACRLQPKIRELDFTSNHLIAAYQGNETGLWERRLEEFQKHQLIENFVISFPKCGRTWVRFVLGTYALQANIGDPLELVLATSRSSLLTTTEFSHDDYPMFKTADELECDKSAYINKKIIFLVRDPRDVLVSQYFHLSRRNNAIAPDQLTYDGSISEFIRSPIGSLKSLVQFYNVWLFNSNMPKNFMLMTYEEITENPIIVFNEIVNFLDWPKLEKPTLSKSVELGQFGRMKELEKKNSLNNFRLRPPKNGDVEAYKVRRGVVGGYRKYLNSEDQAYIGNYLQKHLHDRLNCYKNSG